MHSPMMGVDVQSYRIPEREPHQESSPRAGVQGWPSGGGVVAGFSLRPIALLSEARHQRVAIGRSRSIPLGTGRSGTGPPTGRRRGLRQPPDGVVAGFSLRPIPFLSQARYPRVPSVGSPGLHHRSCGAGPSPTCPCEPSRRDRGMAWQSPLGAIATSALDGACSERSRGARPSSQ